MRPTWGVRGSLVTTSRNGVASDTNNWSFGYHLDCSFRILPLVDLGILGRDLRYLMDRRRMYQPWIRMWQWSNKIERLPTSVIETASRRRLRCLADHLSTFTRNSFDCKVELSVLLLKAYGWRCSSAHSQLSGSKFISVYVCRYIVMFAPGGSLDFLFVRIVRYFLPHRFRSFPSMVVQQMLACDFCFTVQSKWILLCTVQEESRNAQLY